ncbi:MAG: 4Fe-4S dicluster domain-containing protein [Chloroflexi bacterium]|nr:4Fe-4S dicluster domain-containing protein [Chloroflexota bacterium]
MRPSAPTGATLTAEQRRLLLGQYDNTLACIRCGLCLSVCPTYQLTLAEEESPRGRIALARALIEGHLGVTPDLVTHEDNCLLCDACTAICPTGVRMEHLGVALRAALAPYDQRPSWQRDAVRAILRWAFDDLRHMRLVGRLVQLYQQSGLRALARASGVLRLLRVDTPEALLPAVRGGFVVPDGRTWQPPVSNGRRVALLAGCVMSTAFAEVNRATVRVLLANGYAVTLPSGQQCCGALHAHVGDLPAARALARRNIAAFDDADLVVVNAAGCGAMLKEYGHLLADDPDYATAAEALSARVRDVTELLAGDGLRRQPGELPLTVTYQDPCHLAHAQRITAQPRELLRAIPGLRLVEMRESALCCGSAGIYNVLHPETGETLLARKLDNALATGATVIATANPGCALQLQAGLVRRGATPTVRHVVELLDEAYRRGGAYADLPAI